MLKCRKHKLADQNLPARDSARSRNIRRSRKRISAIIRIQVGRITWKKRTTDLLLCDSMPLPDLQGPGSNQSRFASKLFKLAETKSMSSLKRNADISSEYVQISDIKICYGVFGYMEAAYQFWGRLRDGHGGQGEISRRLQARTARISVRYHQSWN